MQEGGDVKSDPCGTTPTTLPSGLEVSESALTLMRAERTAGPDNTDADEQTKREPLSLQETPILWTVSPLAGKTTDRRAGCGRSARPVRREGGSKPIGSPYPYSIVLAPRSDTRGRRDKPGGDGSSVIRNERHVL